MIRLYRKWIVVRESHGKQGFPLIYVSRRDDMMGISNQHLPGFDNDYSWLENRVELGITLTFQELPVCDPQRRSWRVLWESRRASWRKS